MKFKNKTTVLEIGIETLLHNLSLLNLRLSAQQRRSAATEEANVTLFSTGS